MCTVGVPLEVLYLIGCWLALERDVSNHQLPLKYLTRFLQFQTSSSEFTQSLPASGRQRTFSSVESIKELKMSHQAGGKNIIYKRGQTLDSCWY